MKKPRTLTRIAASVLMIPVLYIAATGLLYGIFAVLCSDLVSANWLFALAEIIYVILICMTPVLPIVVVGSSAVGIPLQIRGIRKGEDKKKGLCIVAAFVLLIVLLALSCFALVHYMNTTGGFRS
jgi:hypothetical protein